MPFVPGSVRSLLAAVLLAGLALSVAPGRAAALEPPSPLPGYRPEFVTETDVRPWKDCLWSSGAMLLDKWTNGDRTITHGALRALSGDRGGSSLLDLERSFRRLGFRLEVSSSGHGTLTWPQLLARLQKGAGAVVLGDDSVLPRWYGRWDVAFWKKRGEKDNHAVYVERYEDGRVWLMDPLARGDWQGEWISASALRAFAWFDGGRVEAVTTPIARPAPFKGVRLSSPEVTLSGDALAVSWRLRAPRRWRYPGADIHVRISPAADPLLAAIRTAQLSPHVAAGAAPSRPTVRVTADGRHLRLVTPLPAMPGAYTTSLSLVERRFGRTVLRSRGVGVFVPGPRRASLRLDVNERVLDAGGSMPLTLVVTNAGQLGWADPAGEASGDRAGADDAVGVGRAAAGDGAASRAGARHTRVVAHWLRLDGPSTATEDGVEGTSVDARGAAAAASDIVAGPEATTAARRDGRATDAPAARPVPLEVVLASTPLPPGGVARVRARLRVPEVEGRWALVIDLEDDVDGAFSRLGSAPAVTLLDIVAPRGIPAVE